MQGGRGKASSQAGAGEFLPIDVHSRKERRCCIKATATTHLLAVAELDVPLDNAIVIHHCSGGGGPLPAEPSLANDNAGGMLMMMSLIAMIMAIVMMNGSAHHR